MSTLDDNWSCEPEWTNLCAVCWARVTLPRNVWDHDTFVSCPQCGTLLVFGHRGTILYCEPQQLDAFLGHNRVFTSVPKHILVLVPDSVINEYFAVPFAERNDVLIMSMVHPVEVVIDKLRFILNRKLLAVKIPEEVFVKLIHAEDGLGGDDDR